MDLRRYFQEVKAKEAEIAGEDIYVVSLATPDGGRAGVITQVPKRVGCQLMVEGKARQASAEEVERFREEEAAKRQEFASQEFARKIQVQVVAEPKTGRSEKKAERE